MQRQLTALLRQPDVQLFLLGFGVCVFLKLIFYPSLFVRPEINGDAFRYYWVPAHTGSPWENLLQPDAGYLPLLVRLFAMVERILHLPVWLSPYFYGWITLLVIAFCSNFFCFAVFRPCLASDWQRFFVCLAICFHENAQTHYFLNSAYFGGLVVVLFLTCFEEILGWPRSLRLVTSLFVFMVLLSKGIMLAFAPLIAVRVFQVWRKQDRIGQETILLPALGWLLQAGYISLGYLVPVSSPLSAEGAYLERGRHFWRILKCAGTSLIEIPSSKSAAAIRIGGWIFLLGVLPSVLKELRRKFSPKFVFLSASTVWLMVVSAFLAAVRIGGWIYCGDRSETRGWTPRWELFGRFTFFLLGAICLAHTFRSRKRLAWASLLALSLADSYFTLRPIRSYERSWPIVGFGDWSAFSGDWTKLCLPLNRFPDFGSPHCRLIAGDEKEMKERTYSYQPASGIFPAPQAVSSARLQGLGLAFEDRLGSAQIEIEVLGADQKVLGKARGLNTGRARITHFRFDPPIEGVTHFRLPSSQRLSLRADGVPRSVWVGPPDPPR